MTRDVLPSADKKKRLECFAEREVHPALLVVGFRRGSPPRVETIRAVSSREKQ